MAALERSIAMQVRRVQARGRHHRDEVIAEGLTDGRDDVCAGDVLRLQHDDDLPARASQRRLQGITGTERRSRSDDLICGAIHVHVRPRHQQHLGAGRRRGGEGAQGPLWCGRVRAGDDHDRSDAGRRLVQSGGHRIDPAIERAHSVGDVCRMCRPQFVEGTEVDDLPAGGLDAGLELIGRAVVPRGTSIGALIRERDDVLGH